MRDYLRVLRERRALVLTIVVIATVAALAYSLLREPEYQAAATVAFKDPSEDLRLAGTPAGPSFFPAQNAAANAEIVTRDDVVADVQQTLTLKLTADQLRDRVTAATRTDSNLVEISATDGSATGAAEIANAFAKQTQAAVRERDRTALEEAVAKIKRRLRTVDDVNEEAADRAVIARLTTLSAIAQPVEIVRPAVAPGSPISPKPVRDTFLAALLGLLIGVGAAFLRSSLDRRWTESHEIQRELGLPLVGSVRADILGQTVSANGDRGLSEQDLEGFRILRTNVEFMVKDRMLGTLAVTSALPEEGKSTVAAGFAYASTLAGRRTLLVECDFRRPVMASRTGAERTPGLTEYLGGDGSVKPADILRALPLRSGTSLAMIPAGESSFHPAEMIASDRFREFLEQVGRAYDLIVLDTAPLLPVGDTLELLPLVDSTLLCVRLGQTTREQGRAATVAMQHLPEKPTGLVVTGIRPGSEGDYYGYYSYQSPTAEKSTSSS